MHAKTMFLQTWILLLLLSLCYGDDLGEGCMYNDNDAILHPKMIEVKEKGHLYSPGFQEGKNYPNNMRCAYRLAAPPEMHIRIHFDTLDIDTTDSCDSDSLPIFEFLDEAFELTKMICGTETPYDYVTKSNIAQVEFHADAYATRRGFKITYSVQSTSNVCSSGEKECRNRNCVNSSLVCDGNDDCGDGTDEEECAGAIVPSVECGLPEIDPAKFSDFDRIVGGREAIQGSWPWMADLQTSVIEPISHVCGGSLIEPQWVLTAAHCFMDMRWNRNWRIHLGNHHKFKKDPHEQVRYPERIIIFDDLSPKEFEEGELDIINDVALIKLNAPVKFNRYVKPICIADPSIKIHNTSACYHTGWGMTRGSGSSDVLKQAIHPLQPDSKCQERVGDQFYPKTMICAGSLKPLHGACHGDSGGPLACKTEDGKWNVEGVASYVTDNNLELGLCGLRDRPTVFNRVSVKSAWIRKMIDKYS